MVCGEPCFEDPHLDTLLNPDLIFEILSESTETYDRGRKYVAQSECRIEQFVRQTGGLPSHDLRNCVSLGLDCLQ